VAPDSKLILSSETFFVDNDSNIYGFRCESRKALPFILKFLEVCTSFCSRFSFFIVKEETEFQLSLRTELHDFFFFMLTIKINFQLLSLASR